MAPFTVVQDISAFKYEYMDMNVSALEGGQFRDVKLKDFFGGEKEMAYVAILFYPADFSQLAREEIIEAINLYSYFADAKCQVDVRSNSGYAIAGHEPIKCALPFPDPLLLHGLPSGSPGLGQHVGQRVRGGGRPRPHPAVPHARRQEHAVLQVARGPRRVQHVGQV